MTITVTYDGLEERDEAIDAISVESYRYFIAEFERVLRFEWKHRDNTDEDALVVDRLWDLWHNLKADLPRGGE